MTRARSARGLFAATGHKPKPVAKSLGKGQYAKVAARERDEDDFRPTPAEAPRAFLKAELPRLRQFAAIWEPAAGDGALVREMEECGLTVFASDLVDRGCGAEIRDFFQYMAPPMPNMAISTNPPFSCCNWRDGKGQWIWHALKVLKVEYMALLLPWTWPSPAQLGKLWAAHPPRRVYLMRFRLDFTGQGGPPVYHAWWVWDGAYQGYPELRMLDRDDVRQSDMDV